MSLQPLPINLLNSVRSKLDWFKELEPLINKLQKNHKNFAYKRVLDMVCPKKVSPYHFATFA